MVLIAFGMRHSFKNIPTTTSRTQPPISSIFRKHVCFICEEERFEIEVKDEKEIEVSPVSLVFATPCHYNPPRILISGMFWGNGMRLEFGTADLDRFGTVKYLFA